LRSIQFIETKKPFNYLNGF